MTSYYSFFNKKFNRKLLKCLNTSWNWTDTQDYDDGELHCVRQILLIWCELKKRWTQTVWKRNCWWEMTATAAMWDIYTSESLSSFILQLHRRSAKDFFSILLHIYSSGYSHSDVIHAWLIQHTDSHIQLFCSNCGFIGMEKDIWCSGVVLRLPLVFEWILPHGIYCYKKYRHSVPSE